MVDSSLETSPSSCIKTCRCIPSNSMDSCTFRFLRGSETVSSTVGSSLFSQHPPFFAFCDLCGVTGALLVKIEGKNLLRVPSPCLGNEVSYFLPKRNQFLPDVPFITDIPIENFLVLLDIPSRIKFYQDFGFPNLIFNC